MKIISNTIDITPESEFNSDSVLFFDIETTGLSKERSQVYLIGCAYRKNNFWEIRQYMAESALDEKEVISLFLEFAKKFKTLIHFNGDGFDVPYIDFKAEFYDQDFRLAEMENYDIYKKAKPLKKFLGLEKMNQKAVERFLKINRDDELSGGELIPYYFEYEKTGSRELEKFLLLHNFDDVKGMLKITSITNYLGILKGEFACEHFEDNGWNLTFGLRLEKKLPVPIEVKKDKILIAGSDNYIEAAVEVFEGEAGHQLLDYKNYYYLPKEDKIIHKDVAQFVDKEFRKKATKKNCFVKKESRFLPQNEVIFKPEFVVEGDKKRTYFEVSELDKADKEKIDKYIKNLVARSNESKPKALTRVNLR